MNRYEISEINLDKNDKQKQVDKNSDNLVIITIKIPNTKYYNTEIECKIQNNMGLYWTCKQRLANARGVFSILLNIFDGIFCESIQIFWLLTIFAKKLHHRYLTGF